MASGGAKGCEIYRVRAAAPGRWDVYGELKAVPLASFQDKAAALNYAMCLARGRVAWHLLLRSGAQGFEGRDEHETNELRH